MIFSYNIFNLWNVASLFAYLIKEINDNTIRVTYITLNPVSSREILLCDYLKFHSIRQLAPIIKLMVLVFSSEDTER